MSAVDLFFYSSKNPLQTKASIHPITQASGSFIPKTRYIYHYEAIEAVAKGSQPYLSLCLETSSDQIAVDEPHLIQLLGKTSPSLVTRSPSLPNNLSTKPILTMDPATTEVLMRQISSQPKPNPKLIEHGPRVMEDAFPKAEGKDLILWIDDDLDTVDYKNTPDYDPDQDDTEYGSTSGSELELGSFMSEESKASLEEITSRKYIQLKSIVSEEKVESFGLAPYLLILDIGSPLAPPDLDINPELIGIELSPNNLFLHHFSRYPYLTTDKNYIRKTAYLQHSSDPSAQSRYLIIQEFFMLGSPGKDGKTSRRFGMNWELKRVEAKAWWRKKARGGKGVRVGFYELLEKVEI